MYSNEVTEDLPELPKPPEEPTKRRNKPTSPRALSLRGSGVGLRAGTMHLLETKRTRRERQDDTRTLGSGRNSCRMRQNTNEDVRRVEVKSTHQGELNVSQMSQTTKRLCQVTSTPTKMATWATGTTATAIRMGQVTIPGQEAIWTSEESREAPRSIRTAGMLQMVSNTTGYVPKTMRTSASRERIERSNGWARRVGNCRERLAAPKRWRRRRI